MYIYFTSKHIGESVSSYIVRKTDIKHAGVQTGKMIKYWIKQGIAELHLVIMKKTMRCNREGGPGCFGWRAWEAAWRQHFSLRTMNLYYRCQVLTLCRGRRGAERPLSLNPSHHPQHCMF